MSLLANKMMAESSFTIRIAELIDPHALLISVELDRWLRNAIDALDDFYENDISLQNFK